MQLHDILYFCAAAAEAEAKTGGAPVCDWRKVMDKVCTNALELIDKEGIKGPTDPITIKDVPADVEWELIQNWVRTMERIGAEWVEDLSKNQKIVTLQAEVEALKAKLKHTGLKHTGE